MTKIISNVLGIMILAALAVSACTGKSDKEVKAEKAAKEAAMTPAERAQKAFEDERAYRGFVLTTAIKTSAFDEDALKIKSPVYYKNGVCVSANGKNRFGAYVGWQEHCYLIKNGKWSYSGPG